MRFILLCSLFIYFFSSGCGTHSIAPAADSAYKMPDEEGIQKAVAAAYSAFSFKESNKLNVDRLRTEFIPRAQFIHFNGDSMEILSLEEFITSFKGYIEAMGIKSYIEEEVAGRTDQYGRIAERISTYRAYVNKSDTIAERGVNSFQLIKTPGGWRVSSVIWDIEKPGQPIPGYYLKSDYVR